MTRNEAAGVWFETDRHAMFTAARRHGRRLLAASLSHGRRELPAKIRRKIHCIGQAIRAANRADTALLGDVADERRSRQSEQLMYVEWPMPWYPLGQAPASQLVMIPIAILRMLADIPALGEPPEDGGYPSVLAVLHALEPRPIQADHRRDPILPRIEVSEHPERTAGMLLGGLHDGRHVKEPKLPLFPEAPTRKRVPLLDLVDAAGVPVMTRGTGAPLELRLFVKAVVIVPHADRSRPVVRLAVTVRELVAGLFPSGWRVGRDWPRLRGALMSARNYAIHDGSGLWFPLGVRRIPEKPDSDELVVLDVALPEGAASGPVVQLPEMDPLSVQSAKRWRAYIAAHTLAWAPGRTRVPVRRSGGRRRMWATDRNAYPVLTLEDRRRLAFGADRKHRTRGEIDDAFRDLPGLVLLTERAVDNRTGEVGWRVVPEAAAKAIQGYATGEVRAPAQPGNLVAQPGSKGASAQPGKSCATGESGCATGEKSCATGE